MNIDFTTTDTTSTTVLEPRQPLENDSKENFISKEVLDVCFGLHKKYGPGLLESAYEKLLAFDLVKKKNLKVEVQKVLPLYHDGDVIDAGYRLDMLVSDCVILELKCIEKMLPIHEAQLMTYLKLSGKRLGMVINFNKRYLKNGIRRIVL
jgi:GxxExxY protein